MRARLIDESYRSSATSPSKRERLTSSAIERSFVDTLRTPSSRVSDWTRMTFSSFFSPDIAATCAIVITETISGTLELVSRPHFRKKRMTNQFGFKVAQERAAAAAVVVKFENTEDVVLPSMFALTLL